QHDDRSYSEMRLDNGLRVAVVSDPSVAESALSLSVGVGQFHDPENYQGLAHFLEHMIFQGSRSFPTPYTLKDFIAKHNGHYNAMTEAQLTTYFFTISSAQFDTL
ncbi:insulinase family protein, partial [Pseudoalteromonas phenolica]|uniref:insulinase family protein n=1 Tax=Pseudoalteromonas phenolica TaxID=161398 RepID=UPI0010283BDC